MSATDIVETVTATTMADLLAARDGVTRADLVELRLDGVADVDVTGAVRGRARPVIVTCRPMWEGGRFDGSEEDRLALLAEAVRAGAEYVDVEWRADRQKLPRDGRTQLVISHHDFDGLPNDLEARVRAMRGSGGDVVKIAITARQLRDCVTLKRAVRGDGRQVAIAMGDAGHLTRVWPAWFGSCWTYGGSAAPGQLRTRDLADLYRVKATTAHSAVYGVAGAPLGHSASPAMHNAAFRHLGLDAVYVRLETADASELLEVADAIGLAGASITAPLKETLCQRASAVDPVSERVGAINTLRRGRDGWEGRNFDIEGFLAPLQRRSMSLRRRRAVVLGAGGAARAAVWALHSLEAEVAVSARRPESARALARDCGAQAIGWPPEAGWDLLVNATPVGTWPGADRSPVNRTDLGPCAGRVIYDLVYNPSETQLMRWGREAGAEVIGGLEMLVSQACQQIEWWTGRHAPRAVVDAAARADVRTGSDGRNEADDVR
jgi:3-dehydroquinate dehydratase/shikimate dehydrogenase